MDPVSFATTSVSPNLSSKNGDLQRSAGQAGSFSGLQMGYAVLLLLCICRRVGDARVRSVGSEGLRRVVATDHRDRGVGGKRLVWRATGGSSGARV